VTRFQAARATCPAPADEATDRAPMVEPFGLLHATDAPPAATAPPSGRTDLDALVERAREVHLTRARSVWTPPLPRELSVVDLPRPSGWLAATVGLVDEPARQRQRPLIVDLSEQGHVAVVGGARSGRSSFLHTLVRSLASVHDPSALHVYAVDQGTALRALVELPHVGAVAGRHDPASVLRVLDELHVIAAERAAALLPTDGAAGPAPASAQVLLVVDGLGQLRADHPDDELRLVELATAGPALGIHLAIAAGRWLDFRPALLDALPLRLELRLADPSDSALGRALAAGVPARPGRGLTAAGHHLQLAAAADRLAVRNHPSGLRAPAVSPLPLRVYAPVHEPVHDHANDHAQEPVPSGPTRFPLGIEERRSTPVTLDLVGPGQHVVVHGDATSGRSTLLRRIVRSLAAATPHGADVRVHLVDPSRSLLGVATLPCVAAHAYEPQGTADLVHGLAREIVRRQPPPGLSLAALSERGWWQGPEHVLVVDDYDQLVGPDGSPLAVLVEQLARAGDLGWHVVMARQVSGFGRTAYDPFTVRLREQGPAVLVLGGDAAEARALSGAVTTGFPPGRGRLVRPGRPTVVVQTYLPAVG
jgi:S-DNA-T family DNA segregation ATPase FtsK/SpoIIIE